MKEALDLLDLHHEAFWRIVELAEKTGHPVPMDTRGWSQILVSTLCGVRGLERKKGADLEDGSDVKGANTWKAIDTPRFNGVIKAGTKAEAADTIESLNDMPHLYFVLWDHSIAKNVDRCRIWAVRTKEDELFRNMAAAWYRRRKEGLIISTNFQLHPPRGLETDVFRNTCGNLRYPKYFEAERGPKDEAYRLVMFDPKVLKTGACVNVD